MAKSTFSDGVFRMKLNKNRTSRLTLYLTISFYFFHMAASHLYKYNNNMRFALKVKVKGCFLFCFLYPFSGDVRTVADHQLGAGKRLKERLMISIHPAVAKISTLAA